MGPDSSRQKLVWRQGKFWKHCLISKLKKTFECRNKFLQTSLVTKRGLSRLSKLRSHLNTFNHRVIYYPVLQSKQIVMKLKFNFIKCCLDFLKARHSLGIGFINWKERLKNSMLKKFFSQIYNAYVTQQITLNYTNI